MSLGTDTQARSLVQITSSLQNGHHAIPADSGLESTCGRSHIKKLRLPKQVENWVDYVDVQREQKILKDMQGQEI